MKPGTVRIVLLALGFICPPACVGPRNGVPDLGCPAPPPPRHGGPFSGVRRLWRELAPPPPEPPLTSGPSTLLISSSWGSGWANRCSPPLHRSPTE